MGEENSHDAAADDIQAWVSIRASIGVFDQLVMTLLTQGTLLVFAALGVIFGARASLGSGVTIMLGLGVLFGVVMLHLGVSRYTMSISVAATAAKELEDRLWPDNRAPNRISHRLAGHALAASRRLGRVYYHLWSYSLLFLVVMMLVILSLNATSREGPAENQSNSHQKIQPETGEQPHKAPEAVDQSAAPGRIGQKQPDSPQNIPSRIDNHSREVPKTTH
jgi:hypothetical protein